MIVSASEFEQDVGRFNDVAQRETVTITSDGGASVVLISGAEYERLMRLKREKHAFGGEVNSQFKRAVSKISDTHKDVLDGLSR